MPLIQLRQLPFGKCTDSICVRVSRMWRSTNPALDHMLLSLNAVLIDSSGSTIHGYMPRQLVEYFEEQLIEGSIYQLSNFTIDRDPFQYKPVQNNLVMQLEKDTHITYVGDNAPDIPMHSFNFVPFEKLDERVNDNNYLTDIIGRIVSVGKVEEVQSYKRKSLKRNIKVEEPSMARITVMLWAQHALAFDINNTMQQQGNQPTVIIFAGMIVKKFQNKPAVMQSSAIKFYINLDIPEVMQFISKFPKECPPIKELHQPTTTKRIAEQKTISELLRLPALNLQDTYFMCTATITDIRNCNQWWYYACPKCGKGTRQVENVYYCRVCCTDIETVIPSYKIAAAVADDTGETIFLLLRQTAQQIIRVTMKDIIAVTPLQPNELPTPVSNIIGQRRIFQVTYGSHDGNASGITFKVSNVYPIEPLPVIAQLPYNPGQDSFLLQAHPQQLHQQPPSLPTTVLITSTTTIEKGKATPPAKDTVTSSGTPVTPYELEQKPYTDARGVITSNVKRKLFETESHHEPDEGTSSSIPPQHQLKKPRQ